MLEKNYESLRKKMRKKCNLLISITEYHYKPKKTGGAFDDKYIASSNIRAMASTIYQPNSSLRKLDHTWVK